jgi:hypothetical protein
MQTGLTDDNSKHSGFMAMICAILNTVLFFKSVQNVLDQVTCIIHFKIYSWQCYWTHYFQAVDYHR